MHLVVVLSSIKDISCCGSHCASRVQIQLQGDVFTGTLCFPLLTLQSYLPYSSLKAGSHSGFQLYTM